MTVSFLRAIDGLAAGLYVWPSASGGLCLYGTWIGYMYKYERGANVGRDRIERDGGAVSQV